MKARRQKLLDNSGERFSHALPNMIKLNPLPPKVKPAYADVIRHCTAREVENAPDCAQAENTTQFLGIAPEQVPLAVAAEDAKYLWEMPEED